MSSPRKCLAGPLCAFAILSACTNALDFAAVSSGGTRDAGSSDASERAPPVEGAVFGTDTTVIFEDARGIDRIVESEPDGVPEDGIGEQSDASSGDAGSARVDGAVSDAHVFMDAS